MAIRERNVMGCENLRSLGRSCLSVCDKLAWLPPLLCRLAVGWVFVESGWGRLNNLDMGIEFFTQLGVPAPMIMAPLVSATELGFGTLIFIGLFTRLSALPIIAIMTGAILTAKYQRIDALSTLIGFEEFLYILLMLWLVIHGPGAVSIDHLCRKKCLPAESGQK
jgi:putative oxidoreductase